MRFFLMAELEASDLFANESINWQYCNEHATFAHKEACEFVVHLHNTDETDQEKYFAQLIQGMREYGCTEDFIVALEKAREAGAERILFYV